MSSSAITLSFETGIFGAFKTEKKKIKKIQTRRFVRSKYEVPVLTSDEGRDLNYCQPSATKILRLGLVKAKY